MSLAIDIDKVARILLRDGWHIVQDYSFVIDAYEFIEDRADFNPFVLVGGGSVAGVPATGAGWKEGGVFYFCPLTSILAVGYNTPVEKKYEHLS